MCISICIDEIDVIPSVDQNTKKYSILIIWCFQHKKIVNWWPLYDHINDNNIKAISILRCQNTEKCVLMSTKRFEQLIT